MCLPFLSCLIAVIFNVTTPGYLQYRTTSINLKFKLSQTVQRARTPAPPARPAAPPPQNVCRAGAGKTLCVKLHFYGMTHFTAPALYINLNRQLHCAVYPLHCCRRISKAGPEVISTSFIMFPISNYLLLNQSCISGSFLSALDAIFITKWHLTKMTIYL